ncbi:unnamed protein product [Linum trigynum]|uniref:Retrovirus-related Pol polyprotein from transposon TNT 1-94 n=1 Tax=Linum trigynum TaxID=586398 RepID=A0AAV2CY97_9ROSI
MSQLNGSEKPEDKTKKQWEVLHRKAVAIIRQWIDQSIFHHVAKDTRADELWQKLESMYERQSAQNKASLIRRIVNLKYKDGHSVSEHLSDFQGLVNQLTTMKLALDDEVQALLLLSSLPDSWETLVVSVSNSAPNGKLTMDIVKDSMLNEEARRKELGIAKIEIPTSRTLKIEVTADGDQNQCQDQEEKSHVIIATSPDIRGESAES